MIKTDETKKKDIASSEMESNVQQNPSEALVAQEESKRPQKMARKVSVKAVSQPEKAKEAPSKGPQEMTRKVSVKEV